MKKDFNEYRFEGLKHHRISNKYLSMNRVSENEEKIVVKVGDNHILETAYGYALILDSKNVVFLKNWQVSRNYYGTEVLLDKNYFNVKKWGNFENLFIEENEEEHKFETWSKAAKLQEQEEVKWEDDKNEYKKMIFGGI